MGRLTREKNTGLCATQLHALVVRDLINQTKTSKEPNYCVRVTANDGALGEQHLRDFQDNEKIHPDDPDHLAKTLDGRGCPQRPQHRADAASEHHDRVQSRSSDAARGCLTAKRISRSTTLCGRIIISTIRNGTASRWHQNHRRFIKCESRNLSGQRRRKVARRRRLVMPLRRHAARCG